MQSLRGRNICLRGTEMKVALLSLKGPLLAGFSSSLKWSPVSVRGSAAISPWVSAGAVPIGQNQVLISRIGPRRSLPAHNGSYWRSEGRAESADHCVCLRASSLETRSFFRLRYVPDAFAKNGSVVMLPGHATLPNPFLNDPRRSQPTSFPTPNPT
jgi:hypothetical protein